MHKPKVSVLMPVYNASIFLDEAINSILFQSFSDFEFIIIDDGSVDSSPKIIENYANSDSRIKFISRENKGISATRNELIAIAKGDNIAWMDADDISCVNRIEEQLIYLNHNPDCIVVGCLTELIDTDGDKICQWNVPLLANEIDAWHIKGTGGAIVFASSMMNKNAVCKVGGFNENLTGAEDLCLLLKLAEIGGIVNLNKSLYFYRQHISSISHSAKVKIQHDTQYVIDEARKRRGMPAYQLTNNKKNVNHHDIYIKWGWWALREKNISIANKYARKSILSNPFGAEGWKLLACCIRGY